MSSEWGGNTAATRVRPLPESIRRVLAARGQTRKIRIDFLLASAMISTMPICVNTLLSIPRSDTAATAPSNPNDTTRITAHGMKQISYWNASTRYTSRTANPNAQIAALPTLIDHDSRADRFRAALANLT